MEAHYVMYVQAWKKIISFGDMSTPIPLENGVVQFLRDRADSAGIIQAYSQLSAGRGGASAGEPFDGFTGIIQDRQTPERTSESFIETFEPPDQRQARC